MIVQRSNIALCILAVAVSCGIEACTSKDVYWQPCNGPYGGSIRALAVNDNGLLIAGTSITGIFLSKNKGATWEHSDLMFPHPDFILSVATSGSDTIYAGTSGGGILRSTNRGHTWEQSGLSPYWVNSIAFTNDRRIIAGTWSAGMFYSHDNGITWNKVSVGSMEASSDLGYPLTFVPGTANEIFVGTHGGGVYYSTDNGESWTARREGIASLQINALFREPNGVLFAGTSEGVFRSSNDGLQWSLSGLQNSNIKAITKSLDGQILVGTFGDGILRSGDRGENWIFSGLSGMKVNSLITHPSGIVVAGLDGEGVFCSDDNGATWTEKSEGLHVPYVKSIVEQSEDILFAGTEAGLFKTTDAGRNWHRTTLKATSITSLVVSDAGHVLATAYGSGVYRSIDGGESWHALSDGLGTIYPKLYIHKAKLFAIANGVYRFDDSLRTWISEGLTDYQVVALAFGDEDQMYAGTGVGGVFSSKDAGKTWEGTNLKTPYLYSILVGSDRRLLASTWHNGVFQSLDSGENWDTVKLGSPYFLTRNGSKHVFAGNWNTGAIKYSTDDGQIWNEAGTIAGGVTCLTIDSSGYMYAGTYRRGIFKSQRSLRVYK